MNIETITPVGGKHAIEVMAIGVEWATPLDDNALQRLEGLYRGEQSVAEFLPSITPVRSLALNLGAPDKFVAENSAGGFDLRRFASDGAVTWSVSVRRELISCNCMSYDRWATVKPKAMELLNPFLDAVLELGTQIQGVGLQYQDAFRIEDGSELGTLRRLFRPGSAWVPVHLLDQPSLWHVHQGWFSVSPDNHRTLNNVNLDVLEQESKLLAKINGQHRVFAVSGDGKNPFSLSKDELPKTLEFLHEQNKVVLAGILSDEMLRRINLELRGQK